MNNFFQDINKKLDDIQANKDPNRTSGPNKTIHQIKETISNPNTKTQLKYNLIESFQHETEFKEILKKHTFEPNQRKSFGHNGKTWTVIQKNGKYHVRVENQYKILDEFEVKDA